MGIGKACCHLFLEEQKKGTFRGKVLQLGRQYILFDYPFLKKSAERHACKLHQIENVELSFDAALRNKGYLSDISFFKLLGFEYVDSLDYSPYEAASIIWDMNQPIPALHWNQYDLIFDGGTGEHVFHFPQFMENIYRMLKPGGIVIHLSPAHNYVDHGFYMFSPTLHYEYYLANSFKIVNSLIIESFIKRKTVHAYSYQPGMLKKFDRGGFGKQTLDIFMVAEKTSESKCGVIPQQLSNQIVWAKTPTNSQLPIRKKSILSKLWRIVFKPWIPSSNKMPPKIATYEI